MRSVLAGMVLCLVIGSKSLAGSPSLEWAAKALAIGWDGRLNVAVDGVYADVETDRGVYGVGDVDCWRFEIGELLIAAEQRKKPACLVFVVMDDVEVPSSLHDEAKEMSRAFVVCERARIELLTVKASLLRPAKVPTEPLAARK